MFGKPGKEQQILFACKFDAIMTHYMNKFGWAVG